MSVDALSDGELCPGDRADYCFNMQRFWCYDPNVFASCCFTCYYQRYGFEGRASCPRCCLPTAFLFMFVCLFPACERDDANWCQGMPGYFCYDPSVQQICCFTCPWMRIGPVGRASFWLNFPSLTFLLHTNFPGFLCK